MTRFLRVCLWVSVFALISASSVLAQSPLADAARAQSVQARDITPAPPHLSLVEGQVSLEREGRSESAVENVPLLDGDRIRIERGRAEVMLGDGSLLHLDQSTTADVLASDLIRLIQGRINLVVLGARDPSRAVQYQVDAPTASAQSNGPGEYRVTAVGDAGAGTTELAVVRGDATLGNEAGSVDVRAGERSTARDGEAPSRPQYFNSARLDEFGRWSANRRDEQIGTTSAAYLPEDLEPYSGTFDRYGAWRYEASNGYVWFPTVSADWRPYSVGYWRQYDQWDSFWIARDPWGWPTHHYGRWGFSTSFGWYWRPAGSWAAASVYWALGGDYISWCPLGWNDYPVFGQWGVRGTYVGLHDGWRGWTVIPRRHFGSAVFASHVAIDGRRLDSRTRSSFVAVRRSPTIGRAVPRGQAIATSRTNSGPQSAGARGIDGQGRGGGRQPRSAPSETPRTQVRGQTAGPQQGVTRSLQSATPERYGRRTVPGAPASGGPGSGASATERQAPQSGWNSGRRVDPAAGSGTAERVDRRSLPGAAPRTPAAGGERPTASPRAPSAAAGERSPASASPRTEPRSAPRERSLSMPSSGASERGRSGSTGRSAPGVGSRPERSSPAATPSRGPSSNNGSSSPSSRYNSGSATQRSPDRGTSSPRRGRGGAPE